MKRLFVILLALAILIPGQPSRTLSAPLPPRPFTAQYSPDPAAQAILNALAQRTPALQSIPLVKYSVEVQSHSNDNTWASAWLTPIHPQTGESIPTEPGLAFARLEGDTWGAILPVDAAFSQALADAPSEIITDTVRQAWLAMNQIHTAAQPAAAIGGYALPWEQGKTVYLSRSLAHDADITSKNAHYSFDFYISRTMFNIHAAHSGQVWLFEDTVANGNPDAPNYIVLEDRSTNPVTYQLYMHLAQNSIPPALKQVGAPVSTGQFIGIADDTGMSTGHHLHFQVESLPYWTYWGKSLDITFNDVDINGGRPRVNADFQYCTQPGDVCQTARSAYVSGNIVHNDLTAPWGDLTTPETGLTFSNNVLSLAGWASDDQSGVASIRFKANFKDEWQYIGPTLTTIPFFYNWDMCSDQVPDGPLSLALEIRDADGNLAAGLPGLRHLTKDFACPPPPTCTPAAGQAALFAAADYQGACVLLGSGVHNTSSLASLGSNNAASILVGANTRLTAFDGDGSSGRSESFSASDAGLEDNRLGIDTLSSAKVQAASIPPAVPRPVVPLNNETITGAPFPTVLLHWEDAGGASKFRLRWDGVLQDWQTGVNFMVGGVSPGAHNWQVKAGNDNGESDWSALQSFTVQAFAYPAGDAISAPYSDNMETSYDLWGKSRNWDQSTQSNHTSGGMAGWSYEVNTATSGYDNDLPNFGDLTSPPINLPASGYALRFWYRYETETPAQHWDQRRVQVSVDGGTFSDLILLQDDPVNFWLQSQSIDLSAYAGHTVRIRFHFSTLDAGRNAYAGWYIDDFSIATPPIAGCQANGEPDDSLAQARPMSYGQTLVGQTCPAGDVDAYVFSGNAGDQVGATVQAVTPVTPDTVVYLLDADGSSILAMNDDRSPNESTDSLLNYRLTRSGIYYLKVKAWDHPSSGGSHYTYTITLYGGDVQRPTAALITPPGSTFLANGTTTLQVQASDLESGISHVAFYWHSGDWEFGNWSTLGMDWDASNGWSYPFSTTSLPDQKDIAIHVRAYDWAGNWTGAVAWNLWLDRTPPVSAMQALPLTQASSAIFLQWSGSDNLSGIGHIDIQQKPGINWLDWATGISPASNSTWFVGQAGQTYSFRLRAADRVGNQESYPANAEASITLPAYICSAGDEYENDNSPVSATIMSGVGNLETHNFCNPVTGSGWLNDQDWYRLNVKQGQRLSVLVSPGQAGAAANLQLYAANGTTLIVEKAASAFGQPVHLDWRAPADATLYLKITHLDGRVAGDDVIYQIWVGVGLPQFLPILLK